VAPQIFKTKEHLALVNAHLKAYEQEDDDPSAKPAPSPTAPQRNVHAQSDNVARAAFMITNAPKAKLREKSYDDDQNCQDEASRSSRTFRSQELVIVDDEAPPHCRAHQKKGTR